MKIIIKHIFLRDHKYLRGMNINIFYLKNLNKYVSI